MTVDIKCPYCKKETTYDLNYSEDYCEYCNKEITYGEMYKHEENIKTNTIYQIVYMDKDGNFHNTNIEYKNKDIGLKGLELEIGNCNELDMDYIQLYESVYNFDDERISTKLIAEKGLFKLSSGGLK